MPLEQITEWLEVILHLLVMVLILSYVIMEIVVNGKKWQLLMVV